MITVTLIVTTAITFLWITTKRKNQNFKRRPDSQENIKTLRFCPKLDEGKGRGGGGGGYLKALFSANVELREWAWHAYLRYHGSWSRWFSS